MIEKQLIVKVEPPREAALNLLNKYLFIDNKFANTQIHINPNNDSIVSNYTPNAFIEINNNVINSSDNLFNHFERDFVFIQNDNNEQYLNSSNTFLSFNVNSDTNLSRKEIEKEIEIEFKIKNTPKLIDLLNNETFEFGKISESELFVRSLMDNHYLLTKNWINDLYIDYQSNENILIGILHIIKNFDKHESKPQFWSIAMNAILHKNNEIKDLGVRAFENWCSLESIKLLENIDTNVKWLNDYIKAVVGDIKKNNGIFG